VCPSGVQPISSKLSPIWNRRVCALSFPVKETVTEAIASLALGSYWGLQAKGVPVKEGSWGYRLLVVDDPDGNQLFFNYPSEAASEKMARGNRNVT